MIIDIDDDIILPIITAILAVTLTISTFFMTISYHNYIVEELLTQNDELFVDLSIANKELNQYLLVEEDLTSLGASHTQAVYIIKASKAYNLDPKL